MVPLTTTAADWLENSVSALVVGCYQSDETTMPTSATCDNENDNNEDDSDEDICSTDFKPIEAATRSGELQLYIIDLREVCADLRLGEPIHVFDSTSGVQDGKWYQRQPTNSYVKIDTISRMTQMSYIWNKTKYVSEKQVCAYNVMYIQKTVCTGKIYFDEEWQTHYFLYKYVSMLHSLFVSYYIQRMSTTNSYVNIDTKYYLYDVQHITYILNK